MAGFGRRGAGCMVVAAVCLAVLAGCAPTSLSPTAYDITVRIDPPTHRLAGQTVITLERDPASGPDGQWATLDFTLNRALKIEHITAQGATVISHTTSEPPSDTGDEPGNPVATSTNSTQPAAPATEGTTGRAEPAKSAGQPSSAERKPAPSSPNGTDPRLDLSHRLILANVSAAPRVTFTYSGQLVQDVQAGEKRGQIHNRLMAAHIAPEGIYLDERGGWYPFWHRQPDRPAAQLADYHLTVEPVKGMDLVAGACFDADASSSTGKLVWNSSYPMEGLVLAGGPHCVKSRDAAGIHLSLHYSLPEDEQSREVIEKNTDLFLAAAAGYLERYQPLIGPFPFPDYAIVENFFSSGFAFPEFTLLNKALFQMGRRALGHGFLDHEMLHCWWGNGIYVDPGDGNWCEALTSYGANYYGYVLDGDDEGARKHRRNCCMTVSSIKPADDRPLGDFDRAGGPGREVGYSKGTMVFHMLTRRIGQENFWRAMRHLTRDYIGRYANWKTIQDICEEESGVKLDRFMQDWVRTAGAPRIELLSAVWLPEEHAVEVTLAQNETDFGLNVPLQLVYDDGSSKDELASLDGPAATVRLESDKPAHTVVLDPDYQTLRRVRPDELIPSFRVTRSAGRLLIVTPAEPLSRFYDTVIEDSIGRDTSKQITRRTAADVTDTDLAGKSVLVLGDAVRAAPVQALLARTICPVKFEATAFRVDDTLYDSPGHAVLCTVHHPDFPEGAVTLYYGNSETALGRSDLLGYYRDSLVVFQTSSRQVDGETIYEGRPIARRDFETLQSVEVSR
jgi:aminopeptidase N